MGTVTVDKNLLPVSVCLDISTSASKYVTPMISSLPVVKNAIGTVTAGPSPSKPPASESCITLKVSPRAR